MRVNSVRPAIWCPVRIRPGLKRCGKPNVDCMFLSCILVHWDEPRLTIQRFCMWVIQVQLDKRQYVLYCTVHSTYSIVACRLGFGPEAKIIQVFTQDFAWSLTPPLYWYFCARVNYCTHRKFANSAAHLRSKCP
jgi:hypothetical protein